MVKLGVALFLLLSLNTNKIYAQYISATKGKVIYEINNVEFDSEGILIEGWAFLSESQHFNDPNSFKGEIVVRANEDLQYFPMNFKSKDMTEYMKTDYVNKCGYNQYQMQMTQCFYEYTNVAFDAIIPYSAFKTANTYLIGIGINALNAGESYRTYLSGLDLNLQRSDGTNTYKITSSEGSYSFKITQALIKARTKPSLDSEVIKSSGNACSVAYGNDVYLAKGAVFSNVIDHKTIDGVTWYKVKGDIQGCVDGKYVLVEGNEYEIWIPLYSLEYSGDLLVVNVSKITNPTITTEDQTIYVGDITFNPDNYVWGYDETDGELIPKQLSNNLNVFKVGRYQILYQVKNSANKSRIKYLYVDVIERPANTPPEITASDREIKKYAIFNYLEGVYATDFEDGDISDKIQITKYIDTSKSGIQEACYYVEDSNGLSDNKCINVTILERHVDPIYNFGELRFFSVNKPFYNESFPNGWNTRTINKCLNASYPLRVDYY